MEHLAIAALGVGDTAALVTETVLRIATGAFFAISGFNKLTNKGRHETLVATLREAGIKPLSFFQWFVPGVELLAGLGVAFGFITAMAAAGLLAICFVATCVDGYKRVAGWAPINAADKVDDYLYLPEVVYALILLHFVNAGGGPISLDALIVSLL